MMKRRLFPFLLVLLFAQAVLAQEFPTVNRIYSVPAVVYENEPFEIVLGGWFPGMVPPKPRVRNQGIVHTIEMSPAHGGPLVPVQWGERLQFPGGLPAGQHTFRVLIQNDIIGSHQVVVHEKPFESAPRFGNAGDEVVLEGVPFPDCSGPCPPHRVFFGQMPATNLRLETDSLGRPLFIATVPNGSGLTSISVDLPTNQRLTLENAFRYGKGHETDYERVLFPSNFTGRGAHGSDWHTEILIRNDGPVRIAFEPATLPALSPRARSFFPEEPRDGGAFIHAARGLEKYLSYSAHVVDRSRNATDRGAEMPVVRAEDTSSEMRIVDVPMTPLFRSHLRVYGFDDIPAEQSIEILIHRTNGADIQRFVTLPASPVCVNPPCLATTPPFAILDLSAIPELANAGRVGVTLRAPMHDRRIWGFISVANNETQRVTIYSPQHKTPAGVIR